MKKGLLASLMIAMSVVTMAQAVKRTASVQQIWGAYMNQTRFSDKWGIWAEAQLRTKEDFFTNFSTSILRAGLTYYVNDNSKLTAGYAYVTAYPSDNHKKISQPEHRPWQQIQWHTKFTRNRLMQWIRLEERYRRKIANDSTLASGFNFNFRARYNIWYEIPIGKKGVVPGAVSLVLNDEVMVNFGKEIVYNYFDQNRAFIGLKYQVTDHNNIQAGYMNLFQQTAAGNQYRTIHTARIAFFHNLDLRKKKG